VGGVMPLLYMCWLGVRYQMRPRTQPAQPPELLFTDIIAEAERR